MRKRQRKKNARRFLDRLISEPRYVESVGEALRAMIERPSLLNTMAGTDDSAPIVILANFSMVCSLCPAPTAGVLRDGTTLCAQHLEERGYGVIVCSPFLDLDAEPGLTIDVTIKPRETA